MTRRWTIAVLCASSLLAAFEIALGISVSNGGEKMSQFPPHPGKIRKVYEFDGSSRLDDAENVPEGHRFVYLNEQGIEVESADEAIERIPIVEVRMISTDGNGKLVPKERAKVIRIMEYGPEGRLLRSTTMTPD